MTASDGSQLRVTVLERMTVSASGHVVESAERQRICR